MATPAQQLKRTRTERDQADRKRAQSELVGLRKQIRNAKATRSTKLREVKLCCRKARERNRTRAKQARERLQRSIVNTREKARTICELAKGEAQRSSLRDIDKAVEALNAERTTQRQLLVWTKPKRKEATRAERRGESDDEVRNNIDDVGLRIVFDAVRSKIKGSPRRTRTEAFFEWAAEHPAIVYELQEAEAIKELQKLEAEERRIAKALKKRRVTQRAAVPF